MAIVGIIPARMGSSRFPGKSLAPLLGRPMIEHVYRRAACCKSLDGVYIATCDEEIQRAAEGFGAAVIMTSSKHERASDRVAEAAREVNAEILVMVQGDEPMVTPRMIEAALTPLLDDEDLGCVNLVSRCTTEEEFEDPNTIKVVRSGQGFALYFSREPIPSRHLQSFPHLPVFKQVCIIPFRRHVLFTFTELEPTPLEKVESIDMLRLLEHGFRVRLVETDEATHAVDTPADLQHVEQLMRHDPMIDHYLRQPGRYEER